MVRLVLTASMTFHRGPDENLRIKGDACSTAPYTLAATASGLVGGLPSVMNRRGWGCDIWDLANICSCYESLPLRHLSVAMSKTPGRERR